jgi:integrase
LSSWLDFPAHKILTRRALGEYGELTLEKARSKARNWLELLVRGIDPQVQETNQREAEARKRRNTFAAVAEDFIKEKLPGERKGAEAERDIRREFMPAWSERPIAEVTEEDVISVVKAAKGRGAPYQAHNLLTLARRLFKWAKAQRTYGLTASPCADLQPQQLIGKKVPRKRILSNEELQAFWHVTESLGYPYGPLFRMLAFTGQRKSEVAEARWSEIDLARKLWAIPAERMKADAAHLVPLSDDVVRLLKSLPRFTNGECLFSTNFGKTPVNGFSKGKARLDNAMGAALGRALEPFVIHDIRRTMRTGLSALPVPELVREL